MSALLKRYFTPEEYLAMETPAIYKSQYIAGEIFALFGAEPWHAKITSNLVVALGTRFRGWPCDVFSSGMRVRVPAADLYTYPDVSAVCGPQQFETADRPQSLLNPQAIFEVLSPSTEAFDRGDKFARYRRLGSLTNYVLVSSTRMRIEQHICQASGVWTYWEGEHPSNLLQLESLACEVPLSEIYERVTFPESNIGHS